MIRAFSNRALAAAAITLVAAALPVRAPATMVADPQALYTEMRSAYDKAAQHNWDFLSQEVYLSTIFNAGRAYSLQRPNDPAYGELAQLTVQVGSALHYNPLTNHDASVWYVREAADWVQKNGSDATLRTSAANLLERVNSENDPEGLARLAEADATANVDAYPHDTEAALQQVEAEWRGWLLTRDTSWRSLAISHAAQADFPIAHFPTTYGPEFIHEVNLAANGGDGYTAGDQKNASSVIARLKNLKSPLVIASETVVPHDKYLSTLAPADEYFGRMGYSVLGIQNELKHINYMLDYKYGNREAAQTVLVAESIDDMHKVYPRDRDMPMLLYSCLSTLQRMDSDDAKAAAEHLRSILTVEYQDSPEARKVLHPTVNG